jgi:protein-L-isoaspartate(D-aspartate) O-methyltransferase
MAAVPREQFVRSGDVRHAYDDRPLDIGSGQTISQPYVVALMAQLLRLTPSSRALEIGAGSGYAAAVLGHLAREVHGVEWLPELAAEARRRIAALGLTNVQIHVGDGNRGWPSGAPYDAILVSAAPAFVPEPLLEQLVPGGRLVLPVGRAGHEQRLLRVTRGHEGEPTTSEDFGAVAFVPLVSTAG